MARHLLSDAEVLAFLQRGYHVCEPDCPADLLEAICRDTDAMHDPDRPKLPSDATDMFGNPNDLFRRVPGLDALLRNPVIQGALTSLVGERCRLEVHRASHYLAAGHGGQQFHQDGQFRSFGGGWNRHYRRWQLPRKVIAFFYPHDVQLNQAHSEAIPGSQVYSNVPPALEADPLRLNVKAGTFVIMHQNLWHRGTKELVGERRIMLKVLYDRTNEPTAPSWNHKAAPAWTDELLSTAPWVKSAWDWMAGDHTAATDDRDGSALTEQQTALLLSQLADVAADEPAALRSAYTLGRLGAADLVDVLLDRLEAAAAKLDPESPDHKREHQIAVSEETMIGTALTSFGLRGVPKVCERIASCAPSDAGKAHFKALALDCLTDTPGALANEVALECFARCLGDPSAWVRHNAMQGLELSGSAARPYASIVTERLRDDPEPFVSFAAISTLFYMSSPGRSLQEAAGDDEPEGAAAAAGGEHEMDSGLLVPLLQPLTQSEQKLVAWKAKETLHMIEHGLTRSAL